MKAALFHPDGSIQVTELPNPTCGPGEVVVKVRAAGICGSDLHGLHGKNPWNPDKTRSTTPRRDGHELAGNIVEVGAGIDHLRPGDRVAVEPLHLLGCGSCPPCVRGATNLCHTRGLRDGTFRSSAGFSQLDIVLADHAHPLPDHVEFDTATLLDDYACAVHAVNRCPISPNDHVVVVGTGGVGLTVAQVARAAGARRVTVVGRRRAVLDQAIAVGAADTVVDWTEAPTKFAESVRDALGADGAQIVFETVGGGGNTMELSLAAVAPGGVIGILGAFWDNVQIPYHIANKREVDVRWSSSYATHKGQREFDIAMALVASKRVNAADLVTHRFALDDIETAFQAADDKRSSGAIKVVVHPW